MHSWLYRFAGLCTALSILVYGAGAAFADQTFAVDMGPGGRFAFAPTSFSIGVGEKITFNASNVDTRPHDVQIEGPGGFSWKMTTGGNVAAGQKGSGTTPAFTAAGAYTIFCPVGQHRANGMLASLQVGPAAAALPRTGDPMSLVAAGLGALGALSLAGGLYIRRRS